MSLGCHLEYEGVSRNLVRLRTRFAVLLFAFAMQQSEDLLHAQTNVGKILGIVRDQSGGVVPDAAVTVRVVSTGVQMAATTYSDGSYSFPSLPIGEYAVTVRATGFKTAEHPGVHVVASEAVTIDFQLEVGETTQSVQVVGQATKVDTTTTTSGTTILASEIANLPLLIQGGARSGLDFIGTLPGVIGGTMGTINGGPEGGVGYLLDGTMGAYAGHGLTGDSFGMPPEGLAEIRLNATNDSEYGAKHSVLSNCA